MRKITLMIFASLLFIVPAFAQGTMTPTSTPQTDAKPKKQTFRANKDQIKQAQKMLKVTETGKMDDDFRTSVKKFQSENSLAQSGTLNRATLEKMNIVLTDKQKEIPVTASSLDASGKTSDGKKRGAVFRANKDQVTEAQTKLKTGGMYAGDLTGKLDDATRDGIRKFQTANGVKVTGTLNKETLVKMGIALTDKQKEM